MDSPRPGSPASGVTILPSVRGRPPLTRQAPGAATASSRPRGSPPSRASRWPAYAVRSQVLGTGRGVVGDLGPGAQAQPLRASPVSTRRPLQQPSGRARSGDAPRAEQLPLWERHQNSRRVGVKWKLSLAAGAPQRAASSGRGQCPGAQALWGYRTGPVWPSTAQRPSVSVLSALLSAGQWPAPSDVQMGL